VTPREARLLERTQAEWVGFEGRVIVHASTASTNDDAKELARSGAASGSFVVADAQTAGRGRAGNSWHSPPGANLYFSQLLRPRFDSALAPAFALVAGCVVAGAIERRLGGASTRVKWPNDVFVGEKKISGILIEAQLRGDELGSLVVGVGVNLATREFPTALAAIATSVAIAGGPDASLDRDALAVELAVELARASSRYEAGGLASFEAELAARDHLRGKRVRVGEHAGIADGIEPDGRLAIRTPGGARTLVASGHVEIG
jgi:BirA family transcriptional regulator, biotin operon repressor / biotin---[acetyl-CoA-carboxylase] ligase